MLLESEVALQITATSQKHTLKKNIQHLAVQDADWLQTPRRFCVLPGHSERQKALVVFFCSARRCCQTLIKKHCAESSSHFLVPTLCLALGSFSFFFRESQLGTGVTTYSTRLSDLQKRTPPKQMRFCLTHK